MWEQWFVEGLGDGRFAVISKTHHCMVDGISGVDIATVLMDADRDAGPPPKKRPWEARPGPSGRSLFFDSLRGQLKDPLQFVREAREPDSQARKLALEVAAGLSPLLGLAQMGPGRPRAHLRELLERDPAGAPIAVADHCFGCTAGAGSSCSGSLQTTP